MFSYPALTRNKNKASRAKQNKKKKTLKMQDQMWKWWLEKENVLHNYSVWQIYTL